MRIFVSKWVAFTELLVDGAFGCVFLYIHPSSRHTIREWRYFILPKALMSTTDQNRHCIVYSLFHITIRGPRLPGLNEPRLKLTITPNMSGDPLERNRVNILGSRPRLPNEKGLKCCEALSGTIFWFDISRILWSLRLLKLDKNIHDYNNGLANNTHTDVNSVESI